ncbi:hypothetical protein NBRC116494_32570 [Aurantivibrio plasticivorans]
MQFTKPMIELVYEIRKRVPSDLKPAVKLANPELIPELIEAYRDSRDTILKTLIRALCEQAGPAWLDALDSPPATHSKLSVHIYRGNVQHKEREASTGDSTAVMERKRKIYRGRVVAG